MEPAATVPHLILQTHAQKIAEAAARRVLHDTFRLLGVDIADIDDMNDLRDDIRFTRRQRQASETRRVELTRSTITAIVSGAVGILLSAATWLFTSGAHRG